MTLPTAADIVAFWREAGPERWFEKNEAFDAEITRRFLPVHEAAAAGKLDGWQDTPEGAFALLILLDQFPRNMFRGSPRAFATDAKALAIAEEAIAKGFDQHYQPPEQRFFYMPHMHSEELADQQRCVRLTTLGGSPSYVEVLTCLEMARDSSTIPNEMPIDNGQGGR